MDNGDRLWRERAWRSAVLSGDERAWRTWYDESFAALWRYVFWRCGGRREVAEEVMQDTWMTAVRRLRRFDPDQGCFAAWLRGIAVNILRNHFRKGRHQGRMQTLTDEGLSSPNDEGTPNQEERAERIARTMAVLPQRYEEVLRAKYLEQQSVVQIAVAWKETPKGIESLLTRARQAFREAYQQGE